MAKKKTEQPENSVEQSEFSEFFKKLQKKTFDPANRKYLKTGFSVIDNLLSDGKGMPLGSYIEISSKSGCGKCVTGDSIVFVNGKLKRIEDDIENIGFTESNEHSEIMSRYGNVHFSHRYKEHVSNVITISDVHGNKITCTPIHPLLVKNEEGNTEWIKAQDIKLKDKIMMASPYIRNGEAIKNREIDILFLDVDFKNSGINGLEFASQLRKVNKEFFLIFLTAHQRYMHVSFYTKVFDYLVKPISKDILTEIITRLKDEFSTNRKLFLKLNKWISIRTSDILYIEKQGNKYILVKK